MQVNQLLRAIVERSGKSYRQVSADLGKSPNWAGTVSMPTRSPALATVADVADVAGIDICLIDRETGAIVATVTPPRRVQEG